ncbi:MULTISPECIES: RNB domain-containing ribonuclease [unclassified Simplicispira]|uniref:RNB domain-containing ribonuclease n=1 Tax=unclassified Simplicispira TaxID=2630407 RepID=UPI000D5D98F3|nr:MULTISPECIES: RNB domain-containing ribonuclease [unclassified Simplicispira]PVY55448.1 exoribonuclease-2 [Simplicispira sp. 125]REG16391.1 exoribonuclease-2 [Simplicispira sp. 110]
MSDTPNDPTAALASTATIARRSDLVRLAVVAMQAHGLAPEFSADALAEMAAIAGPSQESGAGIEDMRALLWCSIDDDDSQDIDQLSVCHEAKDGWRVLVAIADVDALVHKDSAIDLHAQVNTASVYTAARVFPMLPERLSTDLTSLGAHKDRLAIVTEMVVDAQGQVSSFRICRAQVRNQAKLAYDSLAAWLDGNGELPAAARAVPGMDAQLRGQDAAAQALRKRRTAHGALQFETFEARAQVQGEQVVAILQRAHNRARQLIEEFMVATNICTAQFLEKHGGLAMRRVVRSPERWSRVVEVAKKLGDTLPAEPDAKALEAFLERRREADPLRFPDLSLTIVQLMGAGEYVVEDAQPGAPVDHSKTVAVEDYGHFGLAIRDYAHSTAPNRRYPDLISHRLVKAVLASLHSPYSVPELQALAEHCNRQESAAKKVERSLRKSEAALFLQDKRGAEFDAIVTGKNNRGTWVRTLVPPVEGKLMNAGPEVDVGEKLRVKLISTDVAQGFIDFAPSP